MAGIQGTFVHVDGFTHQATIDRVRKVAGKKREVRGFWQVSHTRTHPWVRLYSAATENLEGLCGVISAATGRAVVALDCPTHVAALAYFHFSAGDLRRGLLTGMSEEGVWDKAEGQAEPWESGTWLRDRRPEAGANHDGSLWRLADAVIEFHRLPTTGQKVARFGPAWPLRMLGVFW